MRFDNKIVPKLFGFFLNIFKRASFGSIIERIIYLTDEIKLISESINILKEKSNIKNIELLIGGDLLNQITPSNYALKKTNSSFIGIYAACATSTLGLILGVNFIQSNITKNVVTFTSSHNNAAEKQYRYPVEYGGPKPLSSTFTTTGAASALLSKTKKGIKIESGTIGRVIDSKITNVFHMGGVMAKAAAETAVNG